MSGWWRWCNPGGRAEGWELLPASLPCANLSANRISQVVLERELEGHLGDFGQNSADEILLSTQPSI